jgi:hypothetical protein
MRVDTRSPFTSPRDSDTGLRVWRLEVQKDTVDARDPASSAK